MKEIKVFSNILEANDRLAEQNRKNLAEKKVTALNLIGSPGCGKTTLLENTLKIIAERDEIKAAVIEGDIATSRDAERLRKFDIPIVQINTEGACHLDAGMVCSVMDDLPLDEIDLLFIENVGNLVCPADFDLGERGKVVVISVTEGEDKPQKYPEIFLNSACVTVNKTDLLPYLDIDIEKLYNDIDTVRKGLPRYAVSAKTGEGCDAWVDWLESLCNYAPS